MNINLNHIIDQVVKDKGIDRDVLVEALEAAVLSAANKKYRNTRELEAHYNDEIGEVEVFEFVTVVEEVENSYQEIDLAEAREIDPDVEVGDSLGMVMLGHETTLPVTIADVLHHARAVQRARVPLPGCCCAGWRCCWFASLKWKLALPGLGSAGRCSS